MALSDQEALEHAVEHTREFYSAQNIRDWLMYEVRENFHMIEGDCAGLGQWAYDDFERFRDMDMPIVTANQIAPVVDAVAGFAEQNPLSVDFIPRMDTDTSKLFNDKMDKVARWMEKEGGASDCDKNMVRDVLACGLASCDMILDIDRKNKDFVTLDRVFPGFVGWDATACDKNLKDADCVWRMKIVRRSVIEKMLERKGLAGGYSPGANILATGAIMNIMDRRRFTGIDVDAVFQYQWRELAPHYRVTNPFHDIALSPAGQTPLGGFILETGGKLEGMFGFRLEDPVFDMSPENYNGFMDACEGLGLEVEKTEMERYRYYRALIVGNVAVTNEENLSQSGFTQKFMTGKYSENERMFYGIVRGMKEPQRMFNRNLSRLEKIMSKSALGGDDVEEGAIPGGDIEAFIETKAKAESTGTVLYADGALSGGKARPRQQTQPPPLIGESLNISRDALMASPGVNPALMGASENIDESGLLYSRKVRQGMAVLSWVLLESRRSFKIAQGDIFVDFARAIARAYPGELINITEDNERKFIRLFEDNIADDYLYDVDVKPMTQDEKFEFSKLLLSLSAKIPQLAPLALDGLPYDSKAIDETKKALLPAPPPPPDRDNIALIQAETKRKIAQAEADTEQAALTKAKTLTEIQKLQHGEPVDVGQYAATDAELSQKERELALRERDSERNYQIKMRELDLRDAETAMRIHSIPQRAEPQIQPNQ